MSRSRDTADQINRVDSSAANSTSITIDSSENVLVGKTSNSFGTTGVALNPDGSNNMTRSGDPALALNRLSSDGAILGLYKDGSTVGIIGAASGDMYLGTDNTGFRFVNADSSIRPFDPSTSSIRDNAIDLGSTAARFKDLYLSGGVHLGGTGAANKLSDYESGNWTPTQGNFSTWTSSPTFDATYVKIGNLVFVRVYQSTGTIGWTSGQFMGGLPFEPVAGATGYATNGGPAGDNGNIMFWAGARLYFDKANASEGSIVFSGTYQTLS